MTPENALGLLRGPTTREFLWHNVVNIASRTAGVGNFKITAEPPLSTGKMLFSIAETGPQPGHEFQAVSVPMRNRDTLAAGTDGLHLPNAGPDIMVTGMLTSCAFMYSADKRNMYCAHIEPTRAANPNRIDRGIELGVAITGAQEAFTNDAGAVRYFTKVDYQGTHHVNIMGVRRGDGWSLYVQAIAPGFEKTIVFARQLI